MIGTLISSTPFLLLIALVPVDKNSDIIGGIATTPEALKDTPIVYLDKEVVVQGHFAQSRLAQYYYDWETRPLYEVPMTVGFVRAVNFAFNKLKLKGKSGAVVTHKPVLVLASVQDAVLTSEEIETLTKYIHPDRNLTMFRYNRHDVFLSTDIADTLAAMETAKTWLAEVF